MNAQPTPEEGLAAAMDSLFSDPATRERFEGMVRTLRANMAENPPQGDANGSPPAPDSPGASSPADGLGAILSNPSVMAELPALLAGMKPPPPRPEGPKDAETRRRDLLLALKPFLSKERGNAVDLILQISRLGAVLRLMR